MRNQSLNETNTYVVSGGTPPCKNVAALSQKSPIEQVKQVNTVRSDFYRMLASLCYEEVSAEQIAHMKETDFSSLGESSQQEEGYLLMEKGLYGRPERVRQRLACDYAHTFLAAGEYDDHCAVPYESVFTSSNGLLMQEARESARKTYLKHHVEVHTQGFEPEDHVSFELGFMATLAQKCNGALDEGNLSLAAELNDDAIEFHENHLVNWIDDFCDAVEQCAQTDFYRGASIVLRTFVHGDSETLEDIRHALAQDK